MKATVVGPNYSFFCRQMKVSFFFQKDVLLLKCDTYRLPCKQSFKQVRTDWNF